MSPWRPFGSKLVTNVSNPWRWICTLAVAVSAGAFVGSEFVTNVIGYEVVLNNTFHVSFPAVSVVLFVPILPSVQLG